MLLSVLLFFSNFTYALTLQPGESTTINGTVVSCSDSSSTQSTPEYYCECEYYSGYGYGLNLHDKKTNKWIKRLGGYNHYYDLNGSCLNVMRQTPICN